MKNNIEAVNFNKVRKINKTFNVIGLVIGIVRFVIGAIMLVGLVYGFIKLAGLISQSALDSIISSIKNH